MSYESVIDRPSASSENTKVNIGTDMETASHRKAISSDLTLIHPLLNRSKLQINPSSDASAR